MRQTTVWLGAQRYRVTYADDGRVHSVHQEIVPLRHANYWRTLHPMSRAFRAAVEAAERKNNEEKN